MEEKRAEYNLTVEDLGKRTESVGILLKRQVADGIAKQQAKEEVEMGEK